MPPLRALPLALPWLNLPTHTSMALPITSRSPMVHLPLAESHRRFRCTCSLSRAPVRQPVLRGNRTEPDLRASPGCHPVMATVYGIIRNSPPKSLFGGTVAVTPSPVTACCLAPYSTYSLLAKLLVHSVLDTVYRTVDASSWLMRVFAIGELDAHLVEFVVERIRQCGQLCAQLGRLL